MIPNEVHVAIWGGFAIVVAWLCIRVYSMSGGMRVGAEKFENIDESMTEVANSIEKLSDKIEKGFSDAEKKIDKVDDRLAMFMKNETDALKAIVENFTGKK